MDMTDPPNALPDIPHGHCEISTTVRTQRESPRPTCVVFDPGTEIRLVLYPIENHIFTTMHKPGDVILGGDGTRWRVKQNDFTSLTLIMESDA